MSEKEAFKKEKELITYYRNETNYRLTNQTDGGEGTSGLHIPEEAKKKMSLASKEMWKNENFKNRMTELRHADDGPYQSQQFKEKMRQLCLGKNNPNYDNKWNEEQRKHLSKVRKENELAKGTKNPKAKSIICLETGEVFELVSDAQKKYKVKTISSFSIALRDGRRVAANLHWKSYDESLLDENIRFNKLLDILSTSKKYPICSYQTKEVFNSRNEFLKAKNIGIKKFKKEYSNNKKYEIDNNEYMYVKDYLSRYI